MGDCVDSTTKIVLRLCRENDAEASVASVLRDSSAHTVIRLRPTGGRTALSLLSTLRQVLPLAQTRVIENVLDGTLETEVVVPTKKDEHRAARSLARSRPLARLLFLNFWACFAAGAFLWARAVRAVPVGVRDEL